MTKKLISIYDFRDWKVELLELFAERLIILALSLWNNGAFVFTELKEKKKNIGNLQYRDLSSLLSPELSFSYRF